MPRLETQVSQVFLNPSESRKVSLVLVEERLQGDNHLFLLAELRDVQKRIEHNDLGKICEGIIQAFKSNAKLQGEMMFQESMKAANSTLAEIAHKGRRSWLGKFSAVVALKAGGQVFISNTGHTCAWLKRKNNLGELLAKSKPETEPLKTFTNLTSGKLAEGDSLILASSSIFNYVSVELFSKMLGEELGDACLKLTDILKSSSRPDEGFAVFMLGMTRKAALAESGEELSDLAMPAAVTTPQAKPGKPLRKQVTDSAAKPVPSMPIYAPLPEEMDAPALSESGPEKKSTKMFGIGSLPDIRRFTFNDLRLPTISMSGVASYIRSIRLPRIKYLQGVTGPGKFFLGSFIVFIVLFGMNLAAYGVRKSQSEFNSRFNQAAEVFTGMLADAESSMLYRNQSQAMRQIASAEAELIKLKQLDPSLAVPFQEKFEEMNNKVNRVTVLRNLTPVFESAYPVTMMARAGSGYLISNQNPNSLGVFTDGQMRGLFMLNSTDGDIRGITHVSGIGNMVASRDKVYLANESTKEFEQVLYVSNGDLAGLKFLDPNRICAINRSTNQVIRTTVTAKSASAPASLLKGSVNMADAQDLAIDNEIYVLFPDRVAKFTASGQPANFQMAALSEPAKQMAKIRVGSQIYLLEPVSNRLLILSKTGELLNQVHFPELSEMSDVYVDESLRQMLILNANKVYRITF